MPPISATFEATLHEAFEEARRQRHGFITVEHLLLGLLKDTDARPVLEACDANIGALRETLEEFIEDNTPKLDSSSEVDAEPTLSFQRVIQRAIMHVQQSSKVPDAQVTGANALIAIFGEKVTQGPSRPSFSALPTTSRSP